MTSPTELFFDRLSQATHDPRLTNARGTVRFDIDDGDQTHQWHVAVLHGDVVVSRENGEADGVMHAPRAVFDQIVTGEMNSMSAVLRGAVSYQGDPQFAVLFRRLFGGTEEPATDLPVTEKGQES